MKRLAFLIAALVAACVFADQPAIDWSAAEAVHPAVRLVRLSYEQPRLMKAYAMRVDLKTPGLRFTGSHRDPDWGKPMPDYTNGVGIIRTRRQTTADFMRAERAAGRDMFVAFNAAGWSPWCPPWNHRYGDPGGICISDGIVISDAPRPKNHLFVAWDDGTCAIRDGIPTNRYAQAQVAYRGFDIILTNGVSCVHPRHGKVLHPRTAYGLSADGRWFYALAVDGRQPGWSLGADYDDLVDMLRACGATEGINMDGGGSTTMLYWDGSEPVMVNRHDAARRHCRANGVNMGIYLAH